MSIGDCCGCFLVIGLLFGLFEVCGCLYGGCIFFLIVILNIFVFNIC